jgi:hypothetical protein
MRESHDTALDPSSEGGPEKAARSKTAAHVVAPSMSLPQGDPTEPHGATEHIQYHHPQIR